jgi:hypothetical protein
VIDTGTKPRSIISPRQMINKRPKTNELLTAISWHKLAAKETAKKFDISKECLYALLHLHAIQMETNELVKKCQVEERHIENNRWINLLLEADFVERRGEKTFLYNVTIKGEYVIRAFMIRLSRLVNDTKLSKVRLTREKKERLKPYFRPANKKGIKLYVIEEKVALQNQAGPWKHQPR